MHIHKWLRKCVAAVLAFILLGFLVYPTPSAQACSCGEQSATKRLEKTEAVFQGVVTDIRQNGEDEEVIFAVTKTWKGDKLPERRTLSAPGSCHYRFERGVEYVVFASGYQAEDGSTSLRVYNCWGTAPVSEAHGDIAELDYGLPLNIRHLLPIPEQRYAWYLSLFDAISDICQQPAK
ncbi:hypothetical protein M655_006210 [Brevibacillus sp. NSP2.1]|uniref:hypothetical protein n=2 Tax=Brevibacillus TaxID=55080 RepID=UPI000420207B|nr:hypothetical protein [Brevibacillus sp. NSP2.1]QHZ55282.1 hypothetical protein M655_006210 [Brevibacillus sp. NSP2.1]